jgi:Ca-activated chloride channel family protein
MEFLNPLALYGLLALPLLVIPYLIRRKPRRLIFSSILLFAEMGARASGRPWGRLRLPLIFFLQLFLLALLIFALSEPVFSVRPSRVAIVLDNSASMQAVEDGKSRFQLAQQSARALLTEIGTTGKVDIYLTTPRLEKLRGTTFATAEAARLIGSLEPYDIGDRPLDYDKVLNRLADQQKYDRVHLITDHPVSGQGEKLKAVSIGTPQDNLAITSFQISRASLTSTQLSATSEVTNYSAKDAKIKVDLRGGGAVLASRELTVAAGKSAAALFEGLPQRPYYEAEIGVRDALLVDNRRFAVPPSSQTLRILGVSPRPQALSSLRAIPGVSLNIVSPADYQNTERTGYDLEIFHLATPAELPQTPALFVLPPDNNLVELGKPLSKPAVSNWREPHPLTQYINFSLLRPTYARPLRPRAPGQTIIESPEGPLVFAAQSQGKRYLILGFDPFPYLGRENLPMSVLTLNILDWFIENSGARSKSTGEALVFSAARQGDLIVSPRGDKIPLKSSVTSFPENFYQGVYQLNRGQDKELFAVNLQDTNESDLRRSAPIELHDAVGASKNTSTFFAFWPYLLLTALLLSVVEWFIHPRPPRTILRTSPTSPLHRHA